MQGAETSPRSSSADPKADVINAFRKLAGLKTLSAIVDGEGQLALKKDVKYVAPDRYHIAFDDENGAHVEMIIIADETYIKDGDSWNKIPGRQALVPSFRNSFTDEVLETISDVKFEGDDTINGKAALVYSYKLTTKIGNFKITQKLWVDKSSGLPIKSIAEYAESQEKYLTTVFDSESLVTIEPPPVKK